MTQENIHKTDITQNLTQANLHNLGSLWQTTSQQFDTYFEQEAVKFGYITGSQWPNRVWTYQPFTPTLLKNIKQVAQQSKESLVFSHFDQSSSVADLSIINQGFEQKSIQYGMSMSLSKPFSYEQPLTFTKVHNLADAERWSLVFKACFGYHISVETLQNSWNQISYALIWYKNEIVGTVILYLTEKVAGIHSLGILPAMRGKGLATQAMYQVLNQAINSEATLATLQASAMAKAMYEKIGFTQQFVMTNYQLKDI